MVTKADPTLHWDCTILIVCFLTVLLLIMSVPCIIRGSGWGGGGSGIHYSLKIWPIIHLIKILGYSLKLDQLFMKSKKDGEEI